MVGIGNPLPADLDSSNIGLTKEGGLFQKFINKTGAASVKGTLVHASDTDDNAVETEEADGLDAIGAIYDDGVSDGDLVRVVTSGKSQVLLEDGTASTRGYWCRTSITDAGRVDITNAAPTGGTIAAIEAHLQEVGHCLESKIAGTNVLTLIQMHFN